MYYELYVDVLFLVNFFMDYILLLFVWQTLHCDTKHIRITVGAILGAVLTCVLIILPIPNPLIEFVLLHTIVNSCMIQVGLKIKNISVFLRALVLFYIGAFFVGGIVESISQHIEIGSMVLFFAIIGYYAAIGMWRFLSKLQRWNTHIVEVELIDMETKIKIKGLLDTGNSLCDPISGEPVSVVSKEIAGEIASKNEKKIRYIPYQSVGKTNGSMVIFRIEKMYVSGEKNYCFDNPLLGVSEETVSAAGTYEMILNPNLF